MPYEVGYPVAFRAGGDTTRDAFGKHIQELEKIYGILNALDNGKLSGDALTNAIKEHVNSSNPHPRWTPSLGFSNITGDLNASRVVGELNNATIPSSKVTGLEDFVSGKIPEIPESKGDGITDASLSENGSVTFNNGLIVKWGKDTNIFAGSPEGSYKFPTAFPNQCFIVSLTYIRTPVMAEDCFVQMRTYDRFGFSCVRNRYESKAWAAAGTGVTYIAIGR